jgi:uncharacterized protein (TIGR03067 family)
MNTLACLLIGAVLAVPAGDEKKAPKDTDKLQGVWQVTAANRGALPLKVNVELPTYTFAIVGDRYVFMTHGGTFTLDPENGHFDLQVTAGRYSGKTLPCRYELKDDTLTITLPSSLINPMRPADPKQGDGLAGVTYTLKRDAKATKDDADKALKDRTAALPDKAGFGGVKAVGKGGGGFANPGGGGFGPAAPPAATEKLLERILERLERIEQRLDALEKKLPARDSK